MPELPEVETVVNTLAPRLSGARILDVHLLRADIVSPPSIDLPSLLASRSIQRLSRRAKRILFSLDDQTRFYIHLGMSGRLTLETSALPLAKHTHLIFVVGPARSRKPLYLHFRDPRRFGGLFYLGMNSSEDLLGPEPLEISLVHLRARLSSTSRAIKNALMDQRFLAGLGNIYVDESLHEARVHPLIPANRLTPPQAKALHSAIRKVLTAAINAKGSTLRDYVDAQGRPGAAQRLHRAYGREGAPCCRCQTPIVRVVVAGRSTHFCPRCQIQ